MTTTREVWAVVCEPGRVMYATRPTREEAEAVLAEQRALAEKFGRPRVEQLVAPLFPPAVVAQPPR